MTSNRRVAIVGGGIGGLCAAALLQRSGQRVTVFEQAPQFAEVGAGLQIGPNGVKVLKSLGLADELEALGVRPRHLVLRGWKSGLAISRTAIEGDFERAYGAPYYHVHRADLHTMLVRALAPGTIHAGCRIADMTRDESGAELHFDERSEHFDVVIGADGIHSVIRRALHGAEAPRFTGNVAFRAMVEVDEGLRRRVPMDSTIWVGPGGHVVHYYVRGGQLLNIVAVYETDRWTDESWTQPAGRDELLEAFGGWNRGLTQTLERVQQCNRWALYDRDPLKHWGEGCTTLLGDAAHPMLPFLAQGAVMAMEDAYVLSSELAANPDIAGALRRYEGSRRKRTANLQLAARSRGEAMHVASRTESLRRNVKLFFNSRFGRDDQIKRGQGLYGHDVTRIQAAQGGGSQP